MAEDNQLRCPHCGRVQLFDDAVCPYCGQNLRGKKRVTLRQKADKQRAIQHRNWHRKEEKVTWVPQENQGVWSGEEKKRKESDQQNPWKGRIKKIIALILVLQFGPTVLSILVAIPELVMDGISYVLEEQAEEEWEPEIQMPDLDFPEFEAFSDPGVPTFGADDYFYTSDEELDALDPDALWKRPEDWVDLYPELTDQQRDYMEFLADHMVYSDYTREDMLSRMEEEGISREDGEETIERLQVDFGVQALKYMLMQFRYCSYSPMAMWELLEEEQFTEDEIQYAFDECTVDWYHQMEMQVPSILKYNPSSRQELEDRLIYEEFSVEDVEMYLEDCEIHWEEQALRTLNSPFTVLGTTEEENAEMLEMKGFTPEEIQYALERFEP